MPRKRTHQLSPYLSIRLPDARVELNRQALRAADLATAAPVELIAPRRGGGRHWLLDTRATAAARLCENAGLYSFRTACQLDARYLPAVAADGRLHFELWAELIGQPGVFVLLPTK